MNIEFQVSRKWCVVVVALCFLTTQLFAQPASSVPDVFAGSTPCDPEIRALLRVPSDTKSDLIQWTLTLHRHAKTQAPSTYRLRCDYGEAAQGKPGLAPRAKTLEREGHWNVNRGTKSDADALVYELDGALSLLQVDGSLLQILNRDRSLMVGHGGWSYTLNRAEASEQRIDPSVAATVPDMSYTISPLAVGPTVFGVFEGRTPCHGIARLLQRSEQAGCTKAKWRLTLYQNPQTLAPTTYKIEGTLYRAGLREGSWSIAPGTEADPEAIHYRLGPCKGEPALFLLKGDDNVLFFLNQERKPLVGNAEFSYTLNRRTPGPAKKVQAANP